MWMTNNQLSLLEKGLFDQNTKLQVLYLHENKIIAIESTVFKKLNAIKSLDLRGNICINQDFTSNTLFGNFDCFKKYEILFKPNLDEVYQCKSEREKLSEQLQNCELKECFKLNNDNSQSDTTIFAPHLVILVGVLIILLIAFLISIVKISKLSKDNKFLNAKLDKLCEDHVYEKFD
jgi:hypothetical protein